MDDLVGASLRTQNFYHIPGPNPILSTGPNGTFSHHAWHTSITALSIDAMNLLAHQELFYSVLLIDTDQRMESRGCSRLTGGPAPAPAGTWDDLELECAGGVYEEYGQYFMIYHATGKTDGRPDAAPGAKGYYQVGGATATHPLGPWRKMPENPLLRPGKVGEWDHGQSPMPMLLICATVPPLSD